MVQIQAASSLVRTLFVTAAASIICMPTRMVLWMFMVHLPRIVLSTVQAIPVVISSSRLPVLARESWSPESPKTNKRLTQVYFWKIMRKTNEIYTTWKHLSGYNSKYRTRLFVIKIDNIYCKTILKTWYFCIIFLIITFNNLLFVIKLIWKVGAIWYL